MTTIRRSASVQSSDRKISSKVREQFPRHFQEQDSELIPLIEAYYRWSEQIGQVVESTYSLSQNFTSTDASDEFLEILAEEFLQNVPPNIFVDREFLIRNAKELYKTRGTEEGVKLLFRILFQSEPKISSPREKILRASDGKWSVETYVFVEYLGNSQLDLEGFRIFGTQSKAYATVENAEVFPAGNFNCTRLTITGQNGNFLQDEIITTKYGTPRKARILGTISGYTIKNGGVGYSVGDILEITQGDGVDFTAQVEEIYAPIKKVNNTWIEDIENPEYGKITKLRFLNSGVGYIETPPQCSGADSSLDITFTLGGQSIPVGFWKDNSGMISSNMLLQDGKVYQEYSYIIQSDIESSKYLNPLLKIMHPSGWNVSSIFQIGNPSEIDNGPTLFHLHQGLSREFDTPPNDVGLPPPGTEQSVWVDAWREVDSAPIANWSQSSKRFIEPLIRVNSRQRKEDALQQKEPFPVGFDPKTDLWQSNNDKTIYIGDVWTETLEHYADIPIAEAYVYGMEWFPYHDTFTALQLQITAEGQPLRFNREIFEVSQWYAIEDAPIEHWYDLPMIGLRENPRREYHVYNEAVGFLTGDILVDENGDPIVDEFGEMIYLESTDIIRFSLDNP